MQELTLFENCYVFFKTYVDFLGLKYINEYDVFLSSLTYACWLNGLEINEWVLAGGCGDIFLNYWNCWLVW